MKFLLIHCAVIVFLFAPQNDLRAQEILPPIQLIFTVNAPGAAPYLYYDEVNQDYIGVIKDFFDSMERDGLVEVIYVETKRARSEQLIYSGRADVFFSSLSWLEHPEKVLSSTPLSINKGYLFSLTPFNENFSIASLTNEQICTRRGYVYPSLTNYFKKANRRIDSSSQRTGLNMMIRDRCTYTVMDYNNAMSLFNDSEFCGVTFYHSPKPTNRVENTFIFSKKQAPILPTVNRYLALFKRSGAAAASFERHIDAPKLHCDEDDTQG